MNGVNVPQISHLTILITCCGSCASWKSVAATISSLLPAKQEAFYRHSQKAKPVGLWDEVTYVCETGIELGVVTQKSVHKCDLLMV